MDGGVMDICNRLVGGEFGVRESSVLLEQPPLASYQLGAFPYSVSHSIEQKAKATKCCWAIMGPSIYTLREKAANNSHLALEQRHHISLRWPMAIEGPPLLNFIEGWSAFLSKITKPPEFTLNIFKKSFHVSESHKLGFMQRFRCVVAEGKFLIHTQDGNQRTPKLGYQRHLVGIFSQCTHQGRKR